MRRLKKKLKYIIIILLATLGALEHDIVNYFTPSEITMSEKTVKYDVRYRYILDGDTAVFFLDGEDVTVRFLAVDTPEIDEEGYTEAKNYTDRMLRNANKITLELDPSSPDHDKFDRLLAWVWVDKDLLQAKMVENKTCEIRYLFNEYLYTDFLYKKQKETEKNENSVTQ
ncbi:MAG: thermonuclease family protein [Erysipelotrichaceae bacterium]|nr:thermonuclease family protein [Erysipelotrichaceae bacterium]